MFENLDERVAVFEARRWAYYSERLAHFHDAKKALCSTLTWERVAFAEEFLREEHEAVLERIHRTREQEGYLPEELAGE